MIALRHRPYLWLAVVALVAHTLLLWPTPLVAQTLAALLLFGFLPGLLLVELLFGGSTAPADRWERWLYAGGLGYSVITVGLLLLSYLSGGLTALRLFLAFDGLTLLLAALVVWRDRRQAQVQSGGQRSVEPAGGSVNQRWWVAVGLVILLLIAGSLRLWNLGYAEFLTDEARAILRAAAVVQGQEDVLLIHRKGPVEILLPALTFAVGGRLDEASARLPFALASLAALLAVWRLGWVVWGPLAGWTAALLLALDGYLIGFARFVQYQSVVLLTSALAVLLIARLLHRPGAVVGSFTLGAIFVATGLLSHYDGLVVLLPIALLLGALWRRGQIKRSGLVGGLGLALALDAGLLALFYLPFLRHTHFQATLAYLTGARLGGAGLPYNNLAELFWRSLVYNAPLGVALVGGLLFVALGRGYAGRTRAVWLAGIGLGGVVAGLLGLWRGLATPADLVALPLVMGVVIGVFPSPVGIFERLLWLWLALPLIAAIFLVAQPGTHIYVTTLPAALLAGGVVAQAWQSGERRLGLRRNALLFALPGAVLMAVIFWRGWLYFAYTGVEVLHEQQNQQPATPTAWQRRFTIDRLYGFPLANGWKVVGALYADGTIQGDFETNQRDDLIPDWYTRGQHRCAATANWYFAVDNLESWSQGSTDVAAQVLEQGFAPWGTVTIDGEPRMAIYHRPAEANPERLLPLAEYRERFDAAASFALPLGYPVIEEPIEQPLSVDFAGQIRLVGYKLEHNGPLRPGDHFQLTLYWRAQQPIAQSYKVFIQAFYGAGVMVAQQDATPVCDRYPTNRWQPGELVADVHDVPVAADAPVGEYGLNVGLYLEENFARLPVLDGNGTPVADHVQIGVIRIE